MKLFKNFAMKMIKNKFYFMKYPSNIILIKNIKLFFFVGICIYSYITYSNFFKKMYIIKKRACMYICVC